MKIAYVILHYMAGKDTIECVNSILSATGDSKHESTVIIVDNGSVNDSLDEIKKTFEKSRGVVILHSEKNIGFARGNNIGFRYAKKVINADFIVQLNNDTIINQREFNEIIVELFNREKYAVLGPDIVTVDGYHQNPEKEVKWSKKKLFTFRTKKRVQYVLAHFDIFDRLLKINKGSYSKQKEEREVLDVQLHGACLIFSPIYISEFDGMYDKTFLYMEEDILRLMANQYGFLMMYTPDLVVLHKEDVSSKMIAKTEIERKKNFYKHILDSSRAYVTLKKQFEKDRRKCGN